MKIEHEAKILEVDPETIADRILELGGVDLGESLQRRYVYDLVPADPKKWIRLRDRGNGTVTIAVKEINHDGIDGTREAEDVVGSFDGMAAVLEGMGFEARSYQENRRHSFRLGEVEVEIDFWPRIPAYLEIEASTAELIVATAHKLGFGAEHLTSENTTKIYLRYGIDLIGVREMRFDDDDGLVRCP